MENQESKGARAKYLLKLICHFIFPSTHTYIWSWAFYFQMNP